MTDTTGLLKDKRLLVTGGSKGIGCEIVLTALRSGAEAVYLSRSRSSRHEEMQEAADHSGGRVNWIETDVGDEQSVETGLNAAYEFLGDIDVLVNNAGINRDGLIFRMKTEDWQQVLAVNLTSAFYTCRKVARQMAKRRSGSIINISSVVGLSGNGGQTNYAASKAGLIGFSKSLAKEVASRGVRVNVIAPGFITTDMTDALKEEHKTALLESIPMGRFGTPEEIAHAAVYLASDLSMYMTGQVLTVDGGMVT